MRQVPLNAEAVEWAAAEQGIGSDSELSRRCGIDRSNLRKILDGDRPAYLHHVTALAEALGVDASSLLDKEEAAS